MGHYNSFLVKVWTDDGKNLVRGYIQHVGTEEVVHFLKWEKMVDFIREHLGWYIGDHIYDEVQQIIAEPKQGDK